MSTITTLAAGQITAVDAITIELVETNEHPTVIIVRWPVKPSVLHPHRFGTAADVAARAFAAAAVRLAQIRQERKL
jgi:hypothetical protein